jgi:hypothetical protein
MRKTDIFLAIGQKLQLGAHPPSYSHKTLLAAETYEKGAQMMLAELNEEDVTGDDITQPSTLTLTLTLTLTSNPSLRSTPTQPSPHPYMAYTELEKCLCVPKVLGCFVLNARTSKY